MQYVKSLLSVLDKAEGLWIVLLLAFFYALIGLLLGAHCLYHAHQVARHHISLLFLGGQWSLCTLQPLLLILLHARCILWILPDSPFICVPEEH